MKPSKQIESVIPLEEVVKVTTRDQKQVKTPTELIKVDVPQNGASSHYDLRTSRQKPTTSNGQTIISETTKAVPEEANHLRTRSGNRRHPPATSAQIAPTSAEGIAFKQSHLDAKYPNPYEQKHSEWRSMIAPPAQPIVSNAYPTRHSARKLAPKPDGSSASHQTSGLQKAEQSKPLNRATESAKVPEPLNHNGGLLTRSKLKQQAVLSTTDHPAPKQTIRVLPGDNFYPLRIKLEVPLPRPNSPWTGAKPSKTPHSASDLDDEPDNAVQEISDSEFEAEDPEDDDY